MTPKEKATELVNEFIPYARYFEDGNKFIENAESAKQCALISQNEKIEFLGELWLKGYINEKNYRFEMSKLFEEKQEINNL